MMTAPSLLVTLIVPALFKLPPLVKKAPIVPPLIDPPTALLTEPPPCTSTPHTPLEMCPLLVRVPATATPDPAAVDIDPLLLTLDPIPSAETPLLDVVIVPLFVITETPFAHTPHPQSLGGPDTFIVPVLLSERVPFE
jgi:hypothetical protein